MNFILVPFLLGVRVPTNEDQWKNGPEYTFNASLATIGKLDTNEGQRAGSSLSVSLRCRPEEPDRLRCRFKNASSTKFAPTAFEATAAVPPVNATYTDFDLGDEPFEVKFNDEGIESYAFEERDRVVGNGRANTYRLIANHLSVGSKVGEISSIRRLENLTVGECYATYNAVRRKLEQPSSNEEFQLVWLPDEKIDSEQGTEITKEVQLNDCSFRPVYHRRTRHVGDPLPSETVEKLQSSIGRVFVSNSNFTSESVNRVEIHDSKGEAIGSVLDYIRLSLVSVDPARSDFEKISNPMTVGPVLNEDFTEPI